MECEFPTVNSNPDEIREIFDTVKTIAVLGLSPNETKASHRVAKYLQEVGYRIVPVYPKEETILGEKVYRSLAEIPFEIDMVDICRFRCCSGCLYRPGRCQGLLGAGRTGQQYRCQKSGRCRYEGRTESLFNGSAQGSGVDSRLFSN